MRCGCGWWGLEVPRSRWRLRLRVWWMRDPACGGSTSAGSMRLRCGGGLGRGLLRPGGGWGRAPAAGVMVQAVWFDAGAAAAGRLLLVIHHLAVDGVSWRILVPDLAAAWAQVAGGGVASLPERGTSFRRWAQRLVAHAQDGGRLGELSLWRGMLSAPALSLVDGVLDRHRDVTGTARHLLLTLPASTTGGLLTRVAAAFHCGINEVLLTALVVAVADWCRRGRRGGGRGVASG